MYRDSASRGRPAARKVCSYDALTPQRARINKQRARGLVVDRRLSRAARAGTAGAAVCAFCAARCAKIREAVRPKNGLWGWPSAAGIAQRLARAPPSRLKRAGSARYGTVNTIAGSAPMRIFFGLAHSPTRLLGRTILHRSLKRRVRARGEGKVGQLRWSDCLYFCYDVSSRLIALLFIILTKVR